MLDLNEALRLIMSLPPEKREDMLNLLDRWSKAKQIEGARANFLPFVKYLWQDFVEGYHHKIIAELFDDVIEGRKRRVIINMAPRHTKSEFASIYLPAYFLGRYPKKKVIQASNTADLAVGFGRKVRSIIDRKDFQILFPNVSLSQDSKAAGRWATNLGGEYFAIGAEGTVSGKGADLMIIDDPHSEQEAVIGEYNPEVYDKVMSWYEGGPRQRLQPGGSVILVQTRWHLRDLTGQLIKKQMADEGSDQWEVIELPAILPSGKPIWPEFWKLEELLKTKASIPVSKWNAQYQQNPTSEEGALIKRDHWQDWRDSKPPKDLLTIIQSWDTAFTTSTRADYSACTTWGVFYDSELEKNCLILLDAIRGKWEFPELKRRAKDHYKLYEPNICLIEARAAGHPLIYEMRMMGLPVQDVTVARAGAGQSNDKISRVNNVTDVFASGVIYAPKIHQWAQEVIEECAAFPAGEHDDYVDTVVMAVQRFRQGGWLRTDHDVEDEEDTTSSNRRFKGYY